MRFSLRWLFCLVAFVAVGCLSLIYASEAISRILSAVLFGFLMTSVLGAVFANRIHRPFWIGCAVVGWSYVATGYLPQHVESPRFATSAALVSLHDKVVRRREASPPPGAIMVQGAIAYVESPQWEPFHAAGLSLATFLWSLAGGLVAGWFRRED